MQILETLAPIILLITLGSILARIRFLGTEFMADLNKLAFGIGLPALLFQSAAHASGPPPETLKLFGVMLGATLLVTAAAWIFVRAARLPRTSRGTFIQAAFRGNLAYIGIPVIAYSLADLPGGRGPELLAAAVVIMTAMMIIYNVMAVAVLQHGAMDVRSLLQSILTNPLVLAGGAGLLCGASGLQVPVVLDRVLESLGAIAVPIALLCIGGSLTTNTMRGRISWIAAAVAFKVVGVPLCAWLIARAVGLTPTETRLALILCAAPTAAVSFTMARQMGGDETLAAGAIAASTLASFVSLAVALTIT